MTWVALQYAWKRIGPFDSLIHPFWLILNPLTWILVCLELICLTFQFQSLWSLLNQGKSIERFESDLAHLDIVKEDQTMWDLLSITFETYPNRPCFKYRKFLGTHILSGKPTRIFDINVTTHTYQESQRDCQHLGNFLLKNGCQPGQPKESGLSFVTFCEDACRETTLTMLAATSSGLTLVSCYPALGEQALNHILEETQSRILLINQKQLDGLLTLLESGTLKTSLKTIIVSSYLTCGPAELNFGTRIPGILVIGFEEALQMGLKDPPTNLEIKPPKPEDLALIMYTSGTSGTPKGVCLSHGNLYHSFSGTVSSMGSRHMLESEESRGITSSNRDFVEGTTFMAFLPSAHILSFMIEWRVLIAGASLFYCDFQAITNEKVAMLEKGLTYHDGAASSNIRVAQPYLFAGVPQVFARIQAMIEEKLTGSLLVNYFASVAIYWRKYFTLSLGLSIFERFFHARIRRALGGKLKTMISGGGALNADTFSFLRCCLGNSGVVQGYGLTETAGCTTVMNPYSETCTIGFPVRSASLTVRKPLEEVTDTDEQPYLPSDRWHVDEPVLGRGEILIRGPLLGSEYFKQDSQVFNSPPNDAQLVVSGRRSKNAVGVNHFGFPFLYAMSDDPYASYPWFATGDVGIITLEGSLKIVDRAKNIVKLKGGEYASVQHMECVYGSAPFIDQQKGGIFCYASPEISRVKAFVHVNKPMSPDECLAYFNKIANDKQMGKCERIGSVVLATTEWTPENGLMTPSHKLRRSKLEKHFNLQ